MANSNPKLLKYLKLLPRSWRAGLLRAKIEIPLTFPPSLVFKQVETEDEMQAALALVDEATRLRFSSFLSLPHSAMLVAKWNHEVIACLTVVSDGTLGLPSDTHWSLRRFREQGLNLVETSTLCFKKDLPVHRDQILWGFCKFVYHYATQILKADTLVAFSSRATQHLYTDILQFTPVTDFIQASAPQNSFCAALTFGEDTVRRFRQVYAKRPLPQNLFHFLTEFKTDCIQLPVLAKPRLLRKPRPKVDFDNKALVFLNGATQPQNCHLLNVSDNGLQIRLDQPHHQVLLGKPVVVVFQHDHEWIQCHATIKWLESQKRLGCLVTDKSHSWQKFTSGVWKNARLKEDPQNWTTRKAS